MDYDEKQILQLFIGNEQPFYFKETQRYSTLVAGLRDCRKNTKRDIATGEYSDTVEYGDPGNWLGAIGYFTILDQIGSCYKPSNVIEANTSNNIRLAIENFGYELIDNDNRCLNALIALRNAFFHDFNLLNIPKEDLKALQQHKFTVMADINNLWVVKLPKKQWNGDIEGKDFNDSSDSTFVNLFGLGNLVEEIYKKINLLAQTNQLELKMPILKLVNKYTFVTRPSLSVDND